MITVYGTINPLNGAHIDTSKTLRGAKIHATINKLKTVSKRIGYNATVIAEKIEGKWQNV